MNDRIAETLGIEPNAPKEVHSIDPGPKAEDFDYARKNLKIGIEECLKMMPSLVALASVAESPKMYDSASMFMKMFTDMNEKLVSTGLNVKKVEASIGKKETQKSIPTENNQTKEIAFEGTTEDFLALLLSKKTQEIEILNQE